MAFLWPMFSDGPYTSGIRCIRKTKGDCKLSLRQHLSDCKSLSHSHLPLHWISKQRLATYTGVHSSYVCACNLTMFHIHCSDVLTRATLPSTYAYANLSPRVEWVHLLSCTAYIAKFGRVSLVEGPSLSTGGVVDERVVGDETAGTGSRVGLRDPFLTQHRNNTLPFVHVQ